MKADPPIDEIREVRHRISERFGHNTKALLDHYRLLEKEYQDRIIKSENRLDPTPAGSRPL